MRRVSVLMLLTLMAGCSNAPSTTFHNIDFCKLGMPSRDMVGKRVAFSAWFSGTLETAGLRSEKCPSVLVDVRFPPQTPATFQKPFQPDYRVIMAGLAIGSTPDSQFHGHFRGILREQALAPGGEPTIEQVPYHLDVERIDDISLGRPRFLQPPQR